MIFNTRKEAIEWLTNCWIAWKKHLRVKEYPEFEMNPDGHNKHFQPKSTIQEAYKPVIDFNSELETTTTDATKMKKVGFKATKINF